MKLVLGRMAEESEETKPRTEMVDDTLENVDGDIPVTDVAENNAVSDNASAVTPGDSTVITDGTGPEIAADYEDEQEYRQNHAELLHENTDARSENGTHFVINDGTTKAVYKANAVRYFDKAEKVYKKIDNSLTDDGESLSTVSSSFKSRFNKSLRGGKIFDMEKDGCKVSLNLAEHAADCTLKACEHCDKEMSELLIENASVNTDIQYIVDSNRVKENIIVKDKAESYEYNFTVNIENLNVSVSEDGESVELKSKDTGEVAFTIPKPFMYDANDVYSDAVYYEIESQTDNLLTLKVIADPEFINAGDRAFPVVIDPQIVSSDSSLFSCQNYYRYLESSNGGYSSWYSTSYSYINVNRTTSYEYKCNLAVKKSKLYIQSAKIISAKVKLFARSGYGGYCYVNSVLKYFVPNAYNELDICESFSSTGDYTIVLSPYSYNYNVRLESSGIYAPMLEIEYLENTTDKIAKRTFNLTDGVDGDLNLKTGELVTNFTDITTGSSALPINISHIYKKNSADFNVGNNWRLNLQQKLELNSKQASSNLDVDYFFTDETGDKHAFIDTYYYLNSNNNKVSIEKSDITVTLNGQLTVNLGTDLSPDIREVFRESRTAGGLKIIGQLEGFKNNELLEQRQDELKQAEEYVRSYNNSLKEMVIVNTASGTTAGNILYELGENPDKTAFDAFIDNARNGDGTPNASRIVLSKSEAIQYKSLLLQQVTTGTTRKNSGLLITSTFSTGTDYSDNNLDSKSYKTTTTAYSKYISDLRKMVKDLKADYTTLFKKNNYASSGQISAAGSEPGGNLNYQYKEYMDYLSSHGYTSSNKCCLNTTGNGSGSNLRNNSTASDTVTNLMVPYYHFSNGYCDLKAELERIGDDLDEYFRANDTPGAAVDAQQERQKVLEQRLRVFERNFGNRAEKIRTNIEKFEGEISDAIENAQAALIDLQIAAMHGKRASNLESLLLVYKEYANKVFELKNIKEQIPTAYLIDGDDTIRAFNEDGFLIGLSDSYGNYASLEYDDKKRISNIYDGENSIIAFDYNYSGKLNSIIDDRGRKTEYLYDSAGNLTNINFGTGKKLTIGYSGSNIIKVETSDKIKSTITYVSNKVSNVSTQCTVNVIKDEDYSAGMYALSSVSVSYGGRLAIATHSNGEKEYYYMDSFGNLVGGYSLHGDGSYKEPLSFVYEHSRWGYSVKEKVNLPATYTYGLHTCNCGSLIASISNGLISGETEYMFSALVKATCGPIDERFKTAFHDDSANPVNYSSVFRIRANIKYTDGSTQEYYASCDYRNSNSYESQFIALPVSLDSNKGIRTIELYGDYCGKSGMAYLENIRFTPCTWTAIECDVFGNITKAMSNRTLVGSDNGNYTYCESVSEYTYDKKNRCVCERTKQIAQTGGNEPIVHYDIANYDYNAVGKLVRTESYGEYEKKEDNQTIVVRDLGKGITVSETIFDENGNVIKEISHNSLDSSTKFYSQNECGTDGKVTADIDETGTNKTVYEYLEGTSIVKTTIAPDGGKISYGFNRADTVTAYTQSTEDGEGSTTSLNNTCGELTKLTSGLHTVNYEYDGKRRKTKVILDKDIASAVEYLYSDANYSNGFIDTVTVKKNGTATETRTDKYGNLLTLKVKEGSQSQTPHFTNSFDETGRQISETDHLTNSTVTYRYDPVMRERLNSIEKSSGIDIEEISEANNYDALGQLVSRTVSGAVNHSYSYNYRSNINRDLEFINMPNGYKVWPQTDVLGRSEGKILKDASNNCQYGEYISYLKIGDHGTNTVSSMRYGHMTPKGYVIDDQLKYRYNACGNISEIWENGMLSVKYTYDKLQRLIREDNRKYSDDAFPAGKTVLWTYDNFGNILHKRSTNYTLKTVEEITNFYEENQYAYDGMHPDRLVCVGGQDIFYNEQCLPTSYRGKTFSWNAIGQLTAVNGKAYVYDGNGKVIKKDNLTNTYDLSGRLVKQNNGIEYYYDGNGLSGLKYNGQQYIYRKNAQGDVSAILDTNGNIVVRYIYDAWGNHVIQDTSDIGLGVLNPYRYRSYYYDETSQLYHLKSRFYDPETGRFISQDEVSYLNPEAAGGLNLYAYCLNNPVVLNDYDGTAPKWWEWLINGLVIVAGVVACIVPGGQALGVSLLVAGGSMLASNIMSAAGVDGKVASIVSSALNIVAGIALCFTPFASVGASMIGAGVGGILGGYISESLGFRFETGAMIGSIVGGIIGGQMYKSLTAPPKAMLKGNPNYSTNPNAGNAASTAASKGKAGEQYISKITGYAKNTTKVSGTNRIPDFYKKGSYLIESKNVARQALTRQLKDYVAIANADGVKMQLYVRQGTILTSKLKEAINAGNIILNLFPW